MVELLNFVLLAALCYVQNAAFTWSGRSRSSGDPGYHRYAAWCSNGLYFLTSTVLFKIIAEATSSGVWWEAVLAGVVYTVSTTEGSVAAMHVLLKKEKGKQRVGAR